MFDVQPSAMRRRSNNDPLQASTGNNRSDRSRSSSGSRRGRAAIIVLLLVVTIFVILSSNDELSTANVSRSLREVYKQVDERDQPVAVAVPPTTTIQPYTLQNVLNARQYFTSGYGAIIYDTSSDTFILHYSKDLGCSATCRALMHNFNVVVYALRKLFPDRFTPTLSSEESGEEGDDNNTNTKKQEFALAVSASDIPNIQWTYCLRQLNEDCFTGNAAQELPPILHFGSIFKHAVIPTMIGMPMHRKDHIDCYNEFVVHGRVCRSYLPRSEENPEGAVLPEYITNGGIYEDLIPQVVWRGTDYAYLPQLGLGLSQRPLDYEDIASKSKIDVTHDFNLDQKKIAVAALRERYDHIAPRWQGVIWTAEAELDAEEEEEKKRQEIVDLQTERRKEMRARRGLNEIIVDDDDKGEAILPWCDIKFSRARNSAGPRPYAPASEVEYLRKFEEIGIPCVGESMSLEELGQYKYHVDLGGVGGTTWDGVSCNLFAGVSCFVHIIYTYI